MIGEPRIVKRAVQPYLGIRIQAPFRGMFAQVNNQFPTLEKWLRQHGIEPAGPRFLRYHVIDMAGEMDIEVGVPVAAPLPGDGPVKPFGCRYEAYLTDPKVEPRKKQWEIELSMKLADRRP
jgi:effector-binding domain-containing protein